MIGQHIFVRSRNAQNNAGTWTAAMTPNIVSKDVVRDMIEPHCNMDEAFAQRALLTCAQNNVLRIYRASEDAIVVTRTFWETDRITETSGRKGAYSISYILTEDDIVRFAGDYAGAFDPSVFETYDAMVTRTQQEQITINLQYDLFAHGGMAYDPAIFDTCGFTQETFVALMNGIYAALENGSQLALVLPASLRQAWEERGDNSAEKLIYTIMNLMPDFTRVNLGVTAHWNCQLKDRMVSDMHLVLVHPEKEEELAILKREGTMVLDLDTGKYTSEIPMVSAEYFAFVWKNLRQKDAIEAFWTNARAKYRKLLRSRPNSARAMECIFLIGRVTEENFSNKERLTRSILLAATEFAGAGTRVPAAETYLQEGIDKLGLIGAPLDAEMETALCTMMAQDTEPTSHQVQEYAILLRACEMGTAADTTVEALCDEVTQEQRGAISHYLAYLNNVSDIPADKITLQMTKFLAGIFTRLSTEPVSEFLRHVVKTVQHWAKTLSSADNLKLQQPFFEAYSKYVVTLGDDAELCKAAYDFLFDFAHKVDAETYEVCEKVLFRVESRLFKTEDAAGLDLYARSFLAALPPFTNMQKKDAETCYNRLFRQLYKGLPEISAIALETYSNAITAAQENAAASSTLLSCQEGTLAVVTSNAAWEPATVGKQLLALERINVSALPGYAPSAQRVCQFAKLYNPKDVETYNLLVTYLQSMQNADRPTVYNALAEQGMLQDLFLHVMYTDKASVVYSEIDVALQLGHAQKLKLMSDSTLLEKSAYDLETMRKTFGEWYTASLQSEIQTAAGNTNAEQMISCILQEYRTLSPLRQGAIGFKDTAKAVLDKATSVVFGQLPNTAAVTLSTQLIGEMLRLSADFVHQEKLQNENVLQFIYDFDGAVDAWNLPKIDELCAGSIQKGLSEIACERIKVRLPHLANEDQKRLCMLYYRLMRTPNGAQPDVEKYLQNIGYADRSDVDAATLLLRMVSYLRFENSQAERPFGWAVMGYLSEKIRQNPQSFENAAFWNEYCKVKGREYVQKSDVYRMIEQINSNRNLRFGWPMLLVCLISSIVISGLSLLMFALFAMLGKISTVLTIAVGAFVCIALLVLDILLLPKRSKKQQYIHGRMK